MEEYVYTRDQLKDIDVHTLLPQQEPFVMIGSLTHFEMGTSTTETLIKEDNIFVDNGCFSASGMMENIAQTCAARIGFYNKYILHKDVQVGFIGAVRDFKVYGLAPVGAVITTQVDVVEEIFGMTLARATITASALLAEAEIKLSVRNIERNG
ncbi:MAG: pseudouridylate synthase [Bacteroidales bacterium]|nr:pseudouridylate synthase [Bacteroidales bacterium]